MVEVLAPVIERSPLQIALLDLSSERIEEASVLTTERFGEHVRLGDLVVEVGSARRSLELLREGVIGGYRAHRHYRLADGTVQEVELWIQGLGAEVPRHWALVVFSLEDEEVDFEAGHPQAATLGPLACGVADRDCRVEIVSADAKHVCDVDPEEVIGRRLASFVLGEDRDRAERAGQYAIAEHVGVCVHVRLVHGERLAHVLLVPLSDGNATRLSFVVSPDPQPPPGRDKGRLAEIEQRLWRIALEIQAAGVTLGSPAILSASPLSHLEELSSRQWQILERLARGERVAQIARAMYLSPSTVRNHLVAMYRKFNVHSQAELLDRVRSLETAPHEPPLRERARGERHTPRNQ